jgi:hypothetical protein
MSKTQQYAAGELRPSQFLYSFGVGATIDLPHISALVLGLDTWDTNPTHALELHEPRLLAKVQRVLGEHIQQLVMPPRPNPNGPKDGAQVGIPMGVFPQYLRCPKCEILASVRSGLFVLSPAWRPDQLKYVHLGCPKRGNAKKDPAVLPARFMLACKKGHLDDFPWSDFVHQGQPCTGKPVLALVESGISGEAADIWLLCRACQVKRPMIHAFGDEGAKSLPPCAGRHPHLGTYTGCDQQSRTILLGASNSWFGVTESALSIPQSVDKLGQLIEKYWTELKHIGDGGLAFIKMLRKMPRTSWSVELSPYSDEEIDAAVKGYDPEAQAQAQAQSEDLKTPEWEVFSNPKQAPKSADLELESVPVPESMKEWVEQVVLVKRMREVTALMGFTRITSPRDLEPSEGTWREMLAPLSRQPVPVVPAVESRGEGIFLIFHEEKVRAWCERLDVKKKLEKPLLEAYANRRAKLGFHPPEAGFKGMRYVMLHSLSHVLMRQFSISCGYSAASLRERVYARDAGEEGEPMAGVLIYTAAADSEGTLGGLVALGQPAQLAYHFEQALEQVGLCASDPLCAEHEAGGEQSTMHGAACHACLFAPETSCEYNNRFLDRTALVETVRQERLGFFASAEAELTPFEDQVAVCLSVTDKPLDQGTIQKATGLTAADLQGALSSLISKKIISEVKRGQKTLFKRI